MDGPIIVAIDEPSLAEIGHAVAMAAQPACTARRGAAQGGRQGHRTRHHLCRTVERGGGCGAGCEPRAATWCSRATRPSSRPTRRCSTSGSSRCRASPSAAHASASPSISPDRDGILRRLPSYPDGFAAALLAAAGAPAKPPDGALLQTFGGARTYPTVSYYQALDPEAFLPDGIFRDRIVLVGLSLQNAPTVSAGGADVHATSSTIRTGRLVSGVEIQATILDNLAHGLFIDRASTPVSLLSILLAAALAYMVVWRRTGWKTIAVAVPGVARPVCGSYAVLRYGRVFVAPARADARLFAGRPASAARSTSQPNAGCAAPSRAPSRTICRRRWSRRLARDPSQLRLGGEVRTLSILFCDIRGFTTIAESMKDDPERLTMLINRLLTPLSDVVLAKGGTIDKYIGDCLMAFWNAPLDDPDHALHAVEAALGMEEAVAEVNDELRREAEAARRGANRAARRHRHQHGPLRRRQHGIRAPLRLFGAGRRRQPCLAPRRGLQGPRRGDRHRQVDRRSGVGPDRPASAALDFRQGPQRSRRWSSPRRRAVRRTPRRRDRGVS